LTAAHARELFKPKLNKVFMVILIQTIKRLVKSCSLDCKKLLRFGFGVFGGYRQG